MTNLNIKLKNSQYRLSLKPTVDSQNKILSKVEIKNCFKIFHSQMVSNFWNYTESTANYIL